MSIFSKIKDFAISKLSQIKTKHALRCTTTEQNKRASLNGKVMEAVHTITSEKIKGKQITNLSSFMASVSDPSQVLPPKRLKALEKELRNGRIRAIRASDGAVIRDPKSYSFTKEDIAVSLLSNPEFATSKLRMIMSNLPLIVELLAKESKNISSLERFGLGRKEINQLIIAMKQDPTFSSVIPYGLAQFETITAAADKSSTLDLLVKTCPQVAAAEIKYAINDELALALKVNSSIGKIKSAINTYNGQVSILTEKRTQVLQQQDDLQELNEDADIIDDEVAAVSQTINALTSAPENKGLGDFLAGKWVSGDKIDSKNKTLQTCQERLKQAFLSYASQIDRAPLETDKSKISERTEEIDREIEKLNGQIATESHKKQTKKKQTEIENLKSELAKLKKERTLVSYGYTRGIKLDNVPFVIDSKTLLQRISETQNNRTLEVAPNAEPTDLYSTFSSDNEVIMLTPRQKAYMTKVVDELAVAPEKITPNELKTAVLAYKTALEGTHSVEERRSAYDNIKFDTIKTISNYICSGYSSSQSKQMMKKDTSTKALEEFYFDSLLTSQLAEKTELASNAKDLIILRSAQAKLTSSQRLSHKKVADMKTSLTSNVKAFEEAEQQAKRAIETIKTETKTLKDKGENVRSDETKDAIIVTLSECKLLTESGENLLPKKETTEQGITFTQENPEQIDTTFVETASAACSETLKAMQQNSQALDKVKAFGKEEISSMQELIHSLKIGSEVSVHTQAVTALIAQLNDGLYHQTQEAYTYSPILTKDNEAE